MGSPESFQGVCFGQERRDAPSCLTRRGQEYYPLPWLPDYFEETTTHLGRDLWPYGLRENRKTLESLAQYELEQCLIERPVQVDDLFPAETHKGVEFGRI